MQRGMGLPLKFLNDAHVQLQLQRLIVQRNAGQ